MGNQQSNEKTGPSDEYEMLMMRLQRERDLLLLQSEVNRLRETVRNTSANASHRDVSTENSDDDDSFASTTAAATSARSLLNTPMPTANTSAHTPTDPTHAVTTTADPSAHVLTDAINTAIERELQVQVTRMQQQADALRQTIEMLQIRVVQLSEAEQRASSARAQVPPPTTTSTAAPSMSTSATGMNDIRCFNCSRFGHMQSLCPLPRRPDGSCFRCGLLGHMHRDCPDRQGPPPPQIDETEEEIWNNEPIERPPPPLPPNDEESWD